MKFNLNNNDKTKLNRLFETDDYNKRQSDLFNYLVTLDFTLTNYKEFVDSNLDGYQDIDIESCIAKQDINYYLDNKYHKVLKSCKFSKRQISYSKIKTNNLFLVSSVETDNDYNEIIRLGYFSQDYVYEKLKANRSTWMLITPHEINTMQDSINKSSGNVLVLGLGLGYYPYMISLKDDVKSITIIEKDKKIIKLFKENILENFEFKNKINIINDDALNYIKNANSFDYCFADLWFNEVDGLPLYIKLKNILDCKKYQTDYWIESSFIVMLRRALISALYESFNSIDYNINKTYYDQVVNKYKKIYQDVTFTSYEQIHELLSENKIKKTIALL